MSNFNDTTFEILHGVVDFGKYDYANSMWETIQKHGGDAGMFWGTFIHKELERGGLDLKEDDVFVDLGANVGMSARYAVLKGLKKIYSFEPDSQMVEYFKRNVPQAKIYQYAIDSKSGKEIELYHWPYNKNWEGPKYKVKTLSISDIFHLIGEDRIDYLKVDVEGAEANMFDNVSDSDFKRIHKIFVEHHFPEEFDDFCSFIESKGYSIIKELGAGQNYLYAKRIDTTILTDETKNLMDEIYERKLYNHTFVNIERGDVVVDCESGIGTFSSFAIDNKCKKIYGFELSEDKFKLLSKNIVNKKAKFVLGKIGIESLYFPNILESVDEDKINYIRIDLRGNESFFLENLHHLDILKCDKWVIKFYESELIKNYKILIKTIELFLSKNYKVDLKTDVNGVIFFYAKK